VSSEHATFSLAHGSKLNGTDILLIYPVLVTLRVTPKWGQTPRTSGVCQYCNALSSRGAWWVQV